MLFDHFSARSRQLANRIVMAPMTRSRATVLHAPDALMATYHGQRATAGLVARMRKDAPLNAPNPATFYVSGARGYTDYPALAA
jgi:NADH:flavin oxidoreductase / NADH oxidase family